MTVDCPFCTMRFRNKSLLSDHMFYCRMLEMNRGKTYVIVGRNDDVIRDLIHVNMDAELYSHRTKKVMHDYPEELEITGGFRICADGSGFGNRWSVFNLMALDRILRGCNDYFYAREATEEDLGLAKYALGVRFDKLVML